MAVCTAKLLFYFCIVPAHLSAGQTNASHCLKTSLMTAADLQAHLKNLKPLSVQMKRFLICVYYFYKNEHIQYILL